MLKFRVVRFERLQLAIQVYIFSPELRVLDMNFSLLKLESLSITVKYLLVPTKLLLGLWKLVFGVIKSLLVCFKLFLTSLECCLSLGKLILTVLENLLVLTKLNLITLKYLLIFAQLLCDGFSYNALLCKGSIVLEGLTFCVLKFLLLRKQFIILRFKVFDTLDMCIVYLDCVPKVRHNERVTHVEVAWDINWLGKFDVAQSLVLSLSFVLALNLTE